jgi:excisionase family DNA binding protein
VTGPLLTADELAERWQVPKAHVYALTRRGEIPTVKLGRYYRYRLDATTAGPEFAIARSYATHLGARPRRLLRMLARVTSATDDSEIAQLIRERPVQPSPVDVMHDERALRAAALTAPARSPQRECSGSSPARLPVTSHRGRL